MVNAQTSPSDLSPKQIRAARALLAWSQQELAKKAEVAASTVADFERGSRTPVTNNLEAMRRALEGAGIRFLPGGAVIGEGLPTQIQKNLTGAPIRWLTVTDLAQWAERRDAQAQLPNLLTKLIRAAHGASVKLHFPSDETVQLPGYDGETEALQESEYVPAGRAIWEIGTQRDGIASKADKDFAKRSTPNNRVAPADATFIFVTPRAWSQGREWADKKRALGIWQDVRVYDATDLIHWVEQYPAVGQWLASQTGAKPKETRQLEDAWQEWSLATRLPLSLDLVLADRDADATAILQLLRGEPGILALQGESIGEVAAFIYAAISQLPEAYAQQYLNRFLVADTAEAGRMLLNSMMPLIVLLMNPEPGLAARLSQAGHHVILAYGPNADTRGESRALARPSRDGIERALIDMGLTEVRAEALARDSSRSLTILRRLIPAAPNALPEWAQSSDRSLRAALLAGSWDERNAADKIKIAQLSGASYDDTVRHLASLLQAAGGPLLKVGSIWKIASPLDAWALLAHYLTPADIENYQAVVLDVLASDDPRYAMKSSDRWQAGVQGIRPEYSGYLRQGVGQTLILCALFNEQARNVPHVDRRAEYIVRTLLEGASRERWWSLARDFRLLAEAAPLSFFDAIDASLQLKEPTIIALFGEDGGPMGGGEYQSNLLWALEALAWSPQYLSRVSEILAQLARLDPGGRYSNRPDNTLSKIFSLWLPQTYAPQAERFRVLDHLRKVEPKVAWALMLSVLPSGHDVITPSAHTIWRDITPNVEEVVTYGLIGTGTQEVSRRLLEDVGHDPERWSDLLTRLNRLAPDPQTILKALKMAEPEINGREARDKLWQTLRHVLHHNRQFPDAGWALSKNILDDVEKLYRDFEPQDAFARIAWLFGAPVELPNPGVEGWRAEQDNLIKARREALSALIKERGLDGVLELVRCVKYPGDIGITLAKLEIDLQEQSQLLERALLGSNAQDRDFARGLIIASFATHGRDWAEALLSKARTAEWSSDVVVAILRALPVNAWTWQQATHAGEEIEALYWQEVDASWLDGSPQDIEFMARRLIAAGRGTQALHVIGHHLSKALPTDVLIDVLQAAVKQPPTSAHHNDVTMFQYYVAEILKVLDEREVLEDTMLELEWAYLPVLEYSGRPAKVLLKALSERPEFFIEVLKALYKPAEDSGVVEPSLEDMERVRAIASQAYDLLRQWDRVPGTQIDGSIDPVALENWVKEARKMAAAVGRGAIGDQKIGEALSASPIDPDGSWPMRAVRDIIEISRSKDIETGFEVGRYNRRGITTRSPGDGGILERELVAQYRAYAKATALEWPRTSAVLERMAKKYEDEARRQDEEAERRDWRG